MGAQGQLPVSLTKQEVKERCSGPETAPKRRPAMKRPAEVQQVLAVLER